MQLYSLASSSNTSAATTRDGTGASSASASAAATDEENDEFPGSTLQNFQRRTLFPSYDPVHRDTLQSVNDHFLTRHASLYSDMCYDVGIDCLSAPPQPLRSESRNSDERVKDPAQYMDEIMMDVHGKRNTTTPEQSLSFTGLGDENDDDSANDQRMLQLIEECISQFEPVKQSVLVRLLNWKLCRSVRESHIHSLVMHHLQSTVTWWSVDSVDGPEIGEYVYHRIDTLSLPGHHIAHVEDKRRQRQQQKQRHHVSGTDQLFGNGDDDVVVADGAGDDDDTSVFHSRVQDTFDLMTSFWGHLFDTQIDRL